MLHIFLGLGPSLSIRSQSPIVRRGNGWGSTPSFFLAGLAALPWGLLRAKSPPVRTLGRGWGFLRFPHAWDDPRLGACAHERAVTYLQMSRLQWPLTSLIWPSYTPPCEDPRGPTDLIAFKHHIEFGPRQSGLPTQRI